MNGPDATAHDSRMAIGPATSVLDTRRFGVPITRIEVVDAEDVPLLVRTCREQGFAMAIIRTDAADLASAQAVEQAGGLLCDTLVYVARRLDSDFVPSASVEGIRDASPTDADDIEAIAAAAFSGYGGHYQADARLDRAAADAGYADWARRSCTVAGVADRVWVIENDGEPAGFLTMRVNDPTETEIVLNAVHPAHQRRGLYTRLVETALVASRALGAQRCIVSTQLPNVPVQRVWARLGFEPASAIHTFHLWFR
jgi:ribosomal protein S18 acetylase RimI-like enzyme